MRHLLVGLASGCPPTVIGVAEASNRKPPVHRIAAAATAAALVFVSPATASAHSPGHHHRSPHVTVLNSDVVAPFQLAVSRGRLYVADGGTSTVSRLRKGSLVPVAHGPQPGEVAGLAFTRSGRTMVYTTTD